MIITVHRGFLPDPEPMSRADGRFNLLNEIASDLPALVSARKIRGILDDLGVLDFTIHVDNYTKLAQETLDNRKFLRLFQIYAYLASAYVWGAQDDEPAKVIPKGVAIPLVELAKAFKVPPILSYLTYCLYNWKFINARAGFSPENLQLVQKFVHCYDEDWFILIHVAIEAAGGQIIEGINAARTASMSHYTDLKLIEALENVLEGMEMVNELLARMPEKCDPDVYFKRVRPYIYGFESVVYDGCFNNAPRTFRGETGAQSSLIPAVQLALGIRHKQSALTRHLEDMRLYMPYPHRYFLEDLEASVFPYTSKRHVRSHDYDIRKSVCVRNNNHLIDVYNSCIEQLISFRRQHFEYAVNYIHKKVDDPKGTGGTPYMNWLKELEKETSDYLIK